MIHFEHELNEMVNRMLGGGLQSSILAAYQQELVEAKTLYEQCLELILRFAFHLSASGGPPGVVESLAAGK